MTAESFGCYWMQVCFQQFYPIRLLFLDAPKNKYTGRFVGKHSSNDARRVFQEQDICKSNINMLVCVTGNIKLIKIAVWL